MRMQLEQEINAKKAEIDDNNHRDVDPDRVKKLEKELKKLEKKKKKMLKAEAKANSQVYTNTMQN